MKWDDLKQYHYHDSMIEKSIQICYYWIFQSNIISIVFSRRVQRTKNFWDVCKSCLSSSVTNVFLLFQIKQLFRDLNITSFFISSDCTNYVQLLDVAVNKFIKDRIKELIDMHFDTNFDQRQSKKYIVNNQRVMLTQWMRQTWKEISWEECWNNTTCI
jgi:hypothetical protein